MQIALLEVCRKVGSGNKALRRHKGMSKDDFLRETALEYVMKTEEASIERKGKSLRPSPH